MDLAKEYIDDLLSHHLITVATQDQHDLSLAMLA